MGLCPCPSKMASAGPTVDKDGKLDSIADSVFVIPDDFTFPSVKKQGLSH